MHFSTIQVEKAKLLCSVLQQQEQKKAEGSAVQPLGRESVKAFLTLWNAEHRSEYWGGQKQKYLNFRGSLVQLSRIQTYCRSS